MFLSVGRKAEGLCSVFWTFRGTEPSICSLLSGCLGATCYLLSFSKGAFIFVSKEMREQESERKRERLLCFGSRTKWQQQRNTWGWTRLELGAPHQPDSPWGWQAPKYLCHPLLLSQEHQQRAGLESSEAWTHTGSLMWMLV